MITLDGIWPMRRPEPTHLFFAAGDSLDRLANMPLVTTVLARSCGVLLCDQDVDEFCMMAMGTYGEHAVDGDEGEQAALLHQERGLRRTWALPPMRRRRRPRRPPSPNAELFDVMCETLDGKVERVVVSTRLTDAPAVVTSGGGVSLAMVQVLKSQPGLVPSCPRCTSCWKDERQAPGVRSPARGS